MFLDLYSSQAKIRNGYPDRRQRENGGLEDMLNFLGIITCKHRNVIRWTMCLVKWSLEVTFWWLRRRIQKKFKGCYGKGNPEQLGVMLDSEEQSAHFVLDTEAVFSGFSCRNIGSSSSKAVEVLADTSDTSCSAADHPCRKCGREHLWALVTTHVGSYCLAVTIDSFDRQVSIIFATQHHKGRLQYKHLFKT